MTKISFNVSKNDLKWLENEIRKLKKFKPDPVIEDLIDIYEREYKRLVELKKSEKI